MLCVLALASCTFCVECFASEPSALELLVLGSDFAVAFHKQKLQKHKSRRTPGDLTHLASGSVDSLLMTRKPTEITCRSGLDQLVFLTFR